MLVTLLCKLGNPNSTYCPLWISLRDSLRLQEAVRLRRAQFYGQCKAKWAVLSQPDLPILPAQWIAPTGIRRALRRNLILVFPASPHESRHELMQADNPSCAPQTRSEDSIPSRYQPNAAIRCLVNWPDWASPLVMHPRKQLPRAMDYPKALRLRASRSRPHRAHKRSRPSNRRLIRRSNGLCPILVTPS